MSTPVTQTRLEFTAIAIASSQRLRTKHSAITRNPCCACGRSFTADTSITSAASQAALRKNFEKGDACFLLFLGGEACPCLVLRPLRNNGHVAGKFEQPAGCKSHWNNK